MLIYVFSCAYNGLFIVFVVFLCWFFFFKQKTAYEMRISDWSSDVCSSDLAAVGGEWFDGLRGVERRGAGAGPRQRAAGRERRRDRPAAGGAGPGGGGDPDPAGSRHAGPSEIGRAHV